jgi:putative ABC transport system substrate-binding protein
MRIRRATLTAAFLFGLFAWPPSADARQPTKVSLIGILSDESRSLLPKRFEPELADGLRDLGWVEGRNIALERRYAEGRNDILPNLAAELVRLQPAVIVAVGTLAALAAKRATETIPIVFTRISDPIEVGLVRSLARPGGNLTGLSVLTKETAAKRLELLIMAVPDVKRMGAVWDPSVPSAGPELKEVEDTAKSLYLELVPSTVQGPGDFMLALEIIAQKGVSALILVPPLHRGWPT